MSNRHCQQQQQQQQQHKHKHGGPVFRDHPDRHCPLRAHGGLCRLWQVLKEERGGDADRGREPSLWRLSVGREL